MSRQRARRVMIFSHDDARRQLLKTGRVLTARGGSPDGLQQEGDV